MPPRVIESRSLGDIDHCVLCLLPWLASRYSPVSGTFLGEGEELHTAPEILAAQALAIFKALAIESRLPYVIRRKLAAWPLQTEETLRAIPRESSLAIRMRKAVASSPAVFASTLRPFRAIDSGYTLEPSNGGPGLMAGAHLLLVEIRPAWYAKHGYTAPPELEAATLARFSNQLLPAFAP